MLDGSQQNVRAADRSSASKPDIHCNIYGTDYTDDKMKMRKIVCISNVSGRRRLVLCTSWRILHASKHISNMPNIGLNSSRLQSLAVSDSWRWGIFTLTFE